MKGGGGCRACRGCASRFSIWITPSPIDPSAQASLHTWHCVLHTVHWCIMVHTANYTHLYPHPHLETNYTGNERTHGWNIFCWPFLTETKREWRFSGHFQSKFLLGALHFALYFFDTKIYDFWGKNRAAVWLQLYSWTWIDLTSVSGVIFWWFSFFLVPLLLI